MTKLKKRIEFLKIQIAHANRLDGWVLKGHKEELIRLEKKLK
jgi:hypothetical protein